MLVLAYTASIGCIAVALVGGSMPWMYLSLGLFAATHAAVWPARGALVPLLVDERYLVQANGMVGMAWQVPLIAGPALAGLLIRLWGHGAPFVFAAAITATGVLTYLAVPDRRKEPEGAPERILPDLVAGFGEGFGTPELAWMLRRSVVGWVAMGLLITLEPLYVKEVLRRGQEVLGLVFSLQGTGALVGSIVLARLREGRGREHPMITLGFIGGGLGFLLYVGTTSVLTACIGATLFGFGFTFFTSPAQALVQRVARQPGKVTGALAMIGEGGPLISAVAVTAAGSRVPVRAWLVGAAVLMFSVGMSGVRRLRPGARADA